MPVNGYSVGKDVKVTITSAGQNGVQAIVLDPTQITQFEAKPMKKEDWSRPLNVPPQPLYMPDGWKGTIEVDRKGNTLDMFQAAFENNFWNTNQNIVGGFIQEYITEPNGTMTLKTYANCMFWVDDPGTAKADGKIPQKIEFSAGICQVSQQSSP